MYQLKTLQSPKEDIAIVSIVIPALNEESGIKKTISSIPKSKINEQGYYLEMLVIDGESTDLTRDIALQLGAKVIVEKRKGYGRAIKTGLESASGDIIVTIDGDGSYPAEFIPAYLENLYKEGLDFISVNRFSKVEKGAMSVIHRIGNKILSVTMHLLYSVDVKDSQSGMWVMKKKNFIDRINLNSDGMSMSEEIKIVAFKFFKSLEVEGNYYKRVGTEKIDTFRDGWNNFKYLFQYKRLLRFAIRQGICSKDDSSMNIKRARVFICNIIIIIIIILHV
jgi:dolichol-phosphate hexosyltransferase